MIFRFHNGWSIGFRGIEYPRLYIRRFKRLVMYVLLDVLIGRLLYGCTRLPKHRIFVFSYYPFYSHAYFESYHTTKPVGISIRSALPLTRWLMTTSRRVSKTTSWYTILYMNWCEIFRQTLQQVHVLWFQHPVLLKWKTELWIHQTGLYWVAISISIEGIVWSSYIFLTNTQNNPTECAYKCMTRVSTFDHFVPQPLFCFTHFRVISDDARPVPTKATYTLCRTALGNILHERQHIVVLHTYRRLYYWPIVQSRLRTIN